jgi:hypothetical protein
MKTTQLAVLRKKLQLLRRPIVEKEILLKLIESFAPSYTVDVLVSRKLIKTIRRWSLYLNMQYQKHISDLLVIAHYCKNEEYALGWLWLYNRYHFTTQIPERMTVYSTKRSGKRIIAGTKVIFRRARQSFLWWIDEQKIEWMPYNLFSPERALIQLIKEKKWESEYQDDIVRQFGTLVDLEKLSALLEQHGSKSLQYLVDETIIKWQK